MLKLIQFIKDNKDWKEKLTLPPYCIKIKEEGNLVLFNYSQIDSDPYNEIVSECRGLVLEKDTWRVVRFAFKRFFNLGEAPAATIDWDSAEATQKEDGTLIFVYYYDGWKVGTRSSFNAEDAPLESGGFKNFRVLFNYVVEKFDFSFEELDKNNTYVLELCSDFNRIVCPYPNPILFHLTTVNNESLEEINTDIGLPKPKYYKLGSKKDYEELVANLPEGTEGIVVKDRYGARVKIKTSLYFELHRMISNGNVTLESAIDMIKSGEDKEFLAYFTSYTDYFNKVRETMIACNNFARQVDEEVVCWKAKNLNIIGDKKSLRKIFAEYIKDFNMRPLFFKAFDGELFNYINKCTTKQYISAFEPIWRDLM